MPNEINFFRIDYYPLQYKLIRLYFNLRIKYKINLEVYTTIAGMGKKFNKTDISDAKNRMRKIYEEEVENCKKTIDEKKLTARYIPHSKLNVECIKSNESLCMFVYIPEFVYFEGPITYDTYTLNEFDDIHKIKTIIDDTKNKIHFIKDTCLDNNFDVNDSIVDKINKYNELLSTINEIVSPFKEIDVDFGNSLVPYYIEKE